MEFNKEKFRNLVLYIFCNSDPAELGAVKLNKILWYSDVNAYLLYGSSITGETYVKMQYGPMSEHVNATLRAMEKQKEIVVNDVPCGPYLKKEYTALAEADLSIFKPQEISLVDQIINKICREFTATGISELSHDRIWQLAMFGEEIPYFTVFSAEMGEIDESDISWVRERMGAISS